MTRQDIIDHLTYKCGLHRSSAIRAVDGIIEAVTCALADGENVTLRGFATIKSVQVAERVGRNINTGKPVVVPAHRSAKLVISQELKEKLNTKAS